jgi:hypothetical protein
MRMNCIGAENASGQQIQSQIVGGLQDRDGEAWPLSLSSTTLSIVAAYGFGEKRQALSISSTREPDSISRANGLILIIPLTILHLHALSDYNYGATFTRAAMVHTFFPLNLHLARPWRRPCVNVAFILTLAAARPQQNNYIFK